MCILHVYIYTHSVIYMMKKYKKHDTVTSSKRINGTWRDTSMKIPIKIWDCGFILQNRGIRGNVVSIDERRKQIGKFVSSCP